MGQDWTVVSGSEEGLTQIGQKGGPRHCVVWNFPIDLTFRSTNIFGWPQIVLAVYGLDGLGRDVIRGYGALHFPTTTGRHVLKVNLFAPQAASPLQRLTAWASAAQAEFVDAKFAAKAAGRDGILQTSTCLLSVADVYSGSSVIQWLGYIGNQHCNQGHDSCWLLGRHHYSAIIDIDRCEIPV